jgi:hypothetical protein
LFSELKVWMIDGDTRAAEHADSRLNVAKALGRLDEF